MATTFFDAVSRIATHVLQGRTDAAGAEQVGEHIDGKDLRLVASLLTAGVVNLPAAFDQATAAGLHTLIGSGSAESDLAVVEGQEVGQGNYLVRWPDQTTDVEHPAADVTNPRIDEIYLVVQDDPFDTNGANVIPRIALRDGTPASTPDPPGPDAGWEAYLLLWSVTVPAGETEASNFTYTDERVQAGPQPLLMAAWEVDESTEVAQVGLTTSMADVASVTLPIPPDWNSWKCAAWASWHPSIPGGVTVNALIRIDGTDQQQLTGLDVDGEVASLTGRRTGMTTTGDRSVSLRAREVSGNAIFDDITLYARAVRTS